MFAAIHDVQLRNTVGNKFNLEHQPQSINRLISSVHHKTRRFEGDDRLIDILINSTIRWDASESSQLLKRKVRRFTDVQIEFQNEVSEAHNDYRSRHCVSLLELDEQLNELAQAYAKDLALTEEDHFDVLDVNGNVFIKSTSARLGNINDAYIYLY